MNAGEIITVVYGVFAVIAVVGILIGLTKSVFPEYTCFHIYKPYDGFRDYKGRLFKEVKCVKCGKYTEKRIRMKRTKGMNLDE